MTFRRPFTSLPRSGRLILAVVALGTAFVPAVSAVKPEPPSSALALAPIAVGDMPSEEVNQALLPATHEEALPENYVPSDLISLAAVGVPQRGGQLLRAIVVPDLATMVEAARQDGVQLWVLSSYRSYGTQAYTYNSYVRAWGQQVADQRSARPGHSQHQLGTAIDFNQLSPGFVGSPEGRWLWDHAHEYGFVFPYTPASVARTGYIFEPWHVRWVGRDLARLMWDAGYQQSNELTADDYVAATRASLLRATEQGSTPGSVS